MNFQCNACESLNQDMLLVPSKARLQKEWDDAESHRVEGLSEFDLRFATKDEQTAFKALRGEGWNDGILKGMTTPQMVNGQVVEPAAWHWKHASAALLSLLKLGKPVSWQDFTVLVQQIAALDKPTPPPTTT